MAIKGRMINGQYKGCLVAAQPKNKDPLWNAIFLESWGEFQVGDALTIEGKHFRPTSGWEDLPYILDRNNGPLPKTKVRPVRVSRAELLAWIQLTHSQAVMAKAAYEGRKNHKASKRDAIVNGGLVNFVSVPEIAVAQAFEILNSLIARTQELKEKL